MNIAKDALWKGILEDLFDDFLFYFYPDWAKKHVDFTKPFEFLDKELGAIYPENEKGTRFADKLVRIPLLSNEEQYLLIHIEVQGYHDPGFPERMFTYFYRIRDRQKKNVMALCILTDKNKKFHPTMYSYEYEKTRLEYHFDTFKVLSKTEAELELQGNPFSIVMLAAKEILSKKKKTDSDLMEWKLNCISKLHDKGYPEIKIKRIMEFIRFYVKFEDKKNNLLLEDKLQNIIKIRKNMGIEETIIEEIKKEATRKGEKRGVITVAKKMKEEGFELSLIMRITGLSEKEIEEL